jgi:serine/threonine protein kinase/Flp pilus assembly protein TadD
MQAQLPTLDEAPVQDPFLGLELGHYRVAEKIGSGGMGVVYRAHDEHLDREVAIKVLRPGSLADESSRKHFHKEALALSKLNHPNIATIYDFDTQQDVDFLVMEYIPGITLSEKLPAGPLPEKEVLRLGIQLAEGLTAAHEHGVVHRDLKPGNLRLTSNERLKILDFGLAKLRQAATESVAAESTLESRAITGTLAYMAPEQLYGEEIDARADIYAAGLVLYEMTTGQRPFVEVESSQLIGAILRRPPIPPTTLNPKLSPELARIIAKCLEKEPENRYQSAKELAVDLRKLQTGMPTELGPTAKPAKWSSLKWVGASVVILASVTALLIGFNIGGWRDRLLGRGSTPRIESLAVLPLANLSGDPQQEYFADGMTEELITNLGKVGALRVISRTSVMQYKQTKKTLPTIARELKVDAVVEGSVLRSGNRVRITAQLIQAKAERHLWAESYERDASDILALQSDVAQAIASRIQAKLTPQEYRLLSISRSVDPAAHEDYLLGRYHWNKMTEDELEKAREYFEKAVALDPNYAPPYASLADYYTETYELRPQIALDRAKGYAEKALALDETLAEAHLSLGSIRFSEWDWGGATQEFLRTVEVNPSFAEAHRRYAVYLSALGHAQEAEKEIRAAQELDPLSVPINTSAGWVAYFSRRYDRAIEQCRKVLELDSNNVNAQDCLGSAYLAKGMYEQAIGACRTATSLSGEDPDRVVCLAQAYAAAGKTAEARRLLANVYQASGRRYVPPYFFALLHAALAENDQAFAWLEKGYREHDPYLIWVKVSPAADLLRADPRLQDLVRRIEPSP